MRQLRAFCVLLMVVGAVFGNSANAQCDSMAVLCAAHISDDFISDGQNYRALLHSDQVAEFHTTLYSGTTYRIAACSGFSDGNLIFRLLDGERNLLYSNADFENSPYWDFRIKSTMECIIEAQVDPTRAESGCAVISIAFKQD